MIFHEMQVFFTISVLFHKEKADFGRKMGDFRALEQGSPLDHFP